VSGIAGIYCFGDGIVRMGQLEMLLSTLSSRGADGCNIWRSDRVGMVHCLFISTPEDLGKTFPYQDEATEIVITADARIDNRDELIGKIGISDNPRLLSDSKIIVEAYKKWGTNCPVELVGDFSFAIWDPRLKQLFCARDHIGARPFFYAISDEYIVFSSDIRGIRSLPEVSSEIDDKRVADYLNLQVDNNSYTFYKNIKRLPPATTLLFKEGTKRLTTYWHLEDVKPCLKENNFEYAEEFKSIFFEAVRCRMRSADPVGCSFSGGLDSSAVLSSARMLGQSSDKLHAFSFNFDWLPEGNLNKIDEREYQQAVIGEGGVEHYSVNCNQYKPFDNLSLHLKCFGEPFFFPHLYLNWRVWAWAGEKNIRVILDGLDGDSVVSHGYEHLRHLAHNLKFTEMLQQMKSLSLVQGIPLKKLFNAFVIYPYMRAPVAFLYKSIRGKLSPLANINDIISKDFAIETGLPLRAAPGLVSFYSARKTHCKALKNPLLTSAAEMTNKFSAQFNIENRSPFFDRRLMEYCFSLPSEQKLQNGWSRFVLREAMKNVVVDKVRTRVGKSNLTPGFIFNLLECHRELIDEIVNSPHPFLKSRINRNILQKQWRGLKEQPYLCPRRYHLNIYNIVVLNSWLEKVCSHDTNMDR